MAEPPTVQLFENPEVPKGFAVFWLGDVAVHVGRLGQLPANINYDAVDLNPDDFAVYLADLEATEAMGEAQGSA